ncbi:hypothetical protein CDAR_273201 [Caerostris darwini]|uniref:Uncharacterized protein n=1 Tax=Caerostris darwini TaxID=1538125 RepID=A0AAV4MGC7_9ARAC|nr:hypothetical protein CDAR_273201 [Caerostris darwini]
MPATSFYIRLLEKRIAHYFTGVGCLLSHKADTHACCTCILNHSKYVSAPPHRSAGQSGDPGCPGITIPPSRLLERGGYGKVAGRATRGFTFSHGGDSKNRDSGRPGKKGLFDFEGGTLI